MSVFKIWMQKSSIEEKKTLANGAHTSVAALRQLAGGYKSDGVVTMSAEMAGRLERASKLIKNKELPELRREYLSPACANCDLLRSCRSNAKKK